MTKKWDRVLIFGLLLAVILSMAAGFDNECETVRENVLRLHILANSDSEEDQALKLPGAGCHPAGNGGGLCEK